MKKVLLMTVMAVLISAATFAEPMGLYLKGGIALPSKVKVELSSSTYSGSLSGEQDTEMGFLGGIEFAKYVNEMVEFGAGGTYEAEVNAKISGKSEKLGLNFIPVFGLLKINMDKWSSMNPYVLGKVGYSLLITSDDDLKDYVGGLYFGIGGGVEINESIFLEGLYSQNSAKNEKDGLKAELTYPKISFNIGLKL